MFILDIILFTLYVCSLIFIYIKYIKKFNNLEDKLINDIQDLINENNNIITDISTYKE